MPPVFDKIYIHEAAHAAMHESGLTDLLSGEISRIFIEEMLAWFLEQHGIEVLNAVSDSLGRPACVDNICLRSGNGNH